MRGKPSDIAHTFSNGLIIIQNCKNKSICRLNNITKETNKRASIKTIKDQNGNIMKNKKEVTSVFSIYFTTFSQGYSQEKYPQNSLQNLFNKFFPLESSYRSCNYNQKIKQHKIAMFEWYRIRTYLFIQEITLQTLDTVITYKVK